MSAEDSAPTAAVIEIAAETIRQLAAAGLGLRLVGQVRVEAMADPRAATGNPN